jgi:hypothetical protein
MKMYLMRCYNFYRNYEKPKILQTTIIQKNSSRVQSSSVRSKKTTIGQKNSSSVQNSSLGNKKTTISQKNSMFDQQNLTHGYRKSTHEYKKSSIIHQKFVEKFNVATTTENFFYYADNGEVIYNYR